MFLGTVTTTLATTYLSLPAEIDAAELSFTQKEMELQNTIDAIETDHPGYDEYDYNLGAIGHDPFTLISYLSAVHTEFTAEGAEHEIQELFDAMYSLTTEEMEETRTRTVTKTGTRIVTNADGTTSTEEYEYEEEEEYTVKILRTTLTVIPLESMTAGRMDSEQVNSLPPIRKQKAGYRYLVHPWIITGITISVVIMDTGKIRTPEQRSFTGAWTLPCRQGPMSMQRITGQ